MFKKVADLCAKFRGDFSQEGDDAVDAMIRKYKWELEDSDDDVEDDDVIKPQSYFVDSWWFNSIIGFIIFCNALAVGVEVNTRVTTGTAPDYWLFVNICFTCIFVVELALRFFFHYDHFILHPHDWTWNIFDLIIVTIAVVDTFVLTPLEYGGTARIALLLRFTRPLRLVRLLRLVKIFKELWLVTHGFLTSLKIISWVCVMLFSLIFVCAIFLTVTVGHNDEQYDPYYVTSGGWDHEIYFKTVWRSFVSLLQVVTLESWSEGIARHVMEEQPWMTAFFIVFVFITTFGLLSIIIGVIVEHAILLSSHDLAKLKKQKENDRQMVFSQLREIFEQADVDDSGSLTLEEVQDALNKPEIYNKLKMIDFPVDDPRQIFMLLDFDDTGELTIEEFITGCVRMKGSAKSKDLLVAQVAVDTMRKHYDNFETELTLFQKKLKNLDKTAKAIVGHGEHVFLDAREFRKRHLTDQQNTNARSTLMALANAPWEKKLRKSHGPAGALQDQPDEGTWTIPRQPAIEDSPSKAQKFLAMTDKSPSRSLDARGPRPPALMDFSGGRREDELALPGTVHPP